MKSKLLWFGLGFASVFLVKYMIVGVQSWNGAFHPKRVEDFSIGV